MGKLALIRRSLLITFTLAAALTFIFSSIVVASASVDQRNDTNDRFIVIFDDVKEKQTAKNYVKQKGGDVIADYHIIPGMAIRLGADKIQGLRGLKGVKEVGIDGKVYAADDELDNSWGVKRIGSGNVHDYNKGNGINVAIIDTGVDYTHPDLDDNYAGGYDFVNGDNDPMDDHGHGTHVAGIVAAEDNNSGVIGVAPKAKIYALKVLNASGEGTWSGVMSTLQWSVENGIQVVNMSLSGTTDAPGLHDAITAAYNAGIVLVAAAGNSGKLRGTGNSIEYPARYDEVIAVGATDSSDKRAYFSSTGDQLELTAPGVNIYSCVLDGGYDYKSGTSMASPHVAGTAALILANDTLKDLNNDNFVDNKDLRLLLQRTADDLGSAGRDSLYGFGLVDAEESAPPVQSTGTICGYVSDSVTNNSIGNATVSVGSRSAATNSDGFYSITNVPVGTYTLTATATGYHNSTVSGVEVNANSITKVNIGLEVEAVQNGSISGTVTTDGGSPIAGAAVSDGTRTATTNTQGEYTISDVPPGNYTVTASADGYENASKEVTVYESLTSQAEFILSAISSSPKVSVKSIDYSIFGGGKHLVITISIVDELSSPVVNASVSIDVSLDQTTYYSGTGTTGTDGKVSFKLTNAPSGTYTTNVTNVTAVDYAWDGNIPDNSYFKNK